MKRNLSAHPVKATLSEIIDYRVKLYSVAAAAAGVSMLALAQPADAEVIVTKKNIPITNRVPVSIDLNKDGIADFEFSLSIYGNLGVPEAYLTVQALTGGKVVGSPARARTSYASALVRGAKIGPSAHFSNHNGSALIEGSVAAHCSTVCYPQSLFGDWGGNQPNRYLGVKFLINGATHYGWVRLTVTTGPEQRLSATITGYAYETIAKKRITAGESSDSVDDTQAQENRVQVKTPGASLGMLALGSEGLALWRREETPPW